MNDIFKALDETIELVRQTYTGFKRFNEAIDYKVEKLIDYANSLSLKKYDMTFTQIDIAYTHLIESMKDITDELEKHRKISISILMCEMWVKLMKIDEGLHKAFIMAEDSKEFDLKPFSELLSDKLGNDVREDLIVTKRDIMAYITMKGL
jgi:hypothetical protein